jgi:hypothetical protein
VDADHRHPSRIGRHRHPFVLLLVVTLFLDSTTPAIRCIPRSPVSGEHVERRSRRAG